MVDLPADVITNILSHLPVTSLLQFRSTSKSWRSLIDSDHFKTLHLRKSKSNFIFCNDSHFDSKLYVVDFPTLSNTVTLNQPLISFENKINVLGSCNGLICIKNPFCDIAILNPSLRKYSILPHLLTSSSLVPNKRFYRRSFGFGFDPFMGDYKLVKICCFIRVGSTFDSQVTLFSCRANAWKTLPSMLYVLYCLETIGVFVDHALHWVVVKGNNKLAGPNLIVAFDFRFEVFNEAPLPELGEGFEINLLHLGRCLSMVVNYQNQNTRIDIWVMKQYECKDSWLKSFTLVEFLELRFLKFATPLGYYSDDDDMKFVFKEDCNKLLLYNLKSKQVSHVTIPRIPNFFDARFWVESLVQPPFPNEQQQALESEYYTSKRRCLRF